MGGRVCRFDFENAPEGSNRVVGFPHVQVRDPKVSNGVGVVRIEVDGLLVTGDRLVVPALLGPEVADLERGRGILGVETNRGVESGEGFLVLLSLLEASPKVAVGMVV